MFIDYPSETRGKLSKSSRTSLQRSARAKISPDLDLRILTHQPQFLKCLPLPRYPPAPLYAHWTGVCLLHTSVTPINYPCMNHADNKSHCTCAHHKILPAFLILIGLSFLLTQLGVMDTETNGLVWPVLVILLGLTKLKGGSCACYMRQS